MVLREALEIIDGAFGRIGGPPFFKEMLRPNGDF